MKIGAINGAALGDGARAAVDVEVADVERFLDRNGDVVNDKLAEKEREFSEAEAEIKMLQMEAEEQKSTIAELTAAVKELKRRVSALSTEASKKSSSEADYKKKLDALETELLKYKERDIGAKMEKLRR